MPIRMFADASLVPVRMLVHAICAHVIASPSARLSALARLRAMPRACSFARMPCASPSARMPCAKLLANTQALESAAHLALVMQHHTLLPMPTCPAHPAGLHVRACCTLGHMSRGNVQALDTAFASAPKSQTRGLTVGHYPTIES